MLLAGSKLRLLDTSDRTFPKRLDMRIRDNVHEEATLDGSVLYQSQVVDNHRARIQVGEKTPVRVLDSGSGNVQAQATVTWEDTGIILEVVPHITNNLQILLDVSAERSGIQTDIPDIGYTFKKQIGQTRLLLDDGETMVIGGLTLSEVERSETGIPLLMDIPVIGALFRTTKTSEKKQDLIILVTPHIVD